MTRDAPPADRPASRPTLGRIRVRGHAHCDRVSRRYEASPKLPQEGARACALRMLPSKSTRLPTFEVLGTTTPRIPSFGRSILRLSKRRSGPPFVHLRLCKSTAGTQQSTHASHADSHAQELGTSTSIFVAILSKVPTPVLYRFSIADLNSVRTPAEQQDSSTHYSLRWRRLDGGMKRPWLELRIELHLPDEPVVLRLPVLVWLLELNLSARQQEWKTKGEVRTHTSNRRKKLGTSL